jgi:hypothetical protein
MRGAALSTLTYRSKLRFWDWLNVRDHTPVEASDRVFVRLWPGGEYSAIASRIVRGGFGFSINSAAACMIWPPDQPPCRH